LSIYICFYKSSCKYWQAGKGRLKRVERRIGYRGPFDPRGGRLNPFSAEND
jgi:hypothetical protein